MNRTYSSGKPLVIHKNERNELDPRGRLLIAGVLGLAMTLAVSGCERIGNMVGGFSEPSGNVPAKPTCRTDVAEWTEEVKLHDGQMVTVWRKATACKGGFLSKRGRDIDEEFKYPPMNLHWKGTFFETWFRGPTSFDIIDGVPLLVLHVGDREYCRNRTKTDYIAQFLRWVDGKWVDVPQAQFPVDRVLMNLSGNFWAYEAKDDYKGFISWDDKDLRGHVDKDTNKNVDTVKSYFERRQQFCHRFSN